MARIVIFKDKQPKEIDIDGKRIWICNCGLTKNWPYCDGSHALAMTEEDKKLYLYENGKRKEVEIKEK